MKCSLCDHEEQHTPGSGWLGGAVGLDDKPKHAYYLCPQCLRYVVAHPDPRDTPDMTKGLDPTKDITHKPNREYGLAFLGTYAMKCEVEMNRAAQGPKQ